MPTNGSSGSGTIPQGADDFTDIRGISPKMANRLYEAGILTFAKLAAMTPGEIVERIGAHSGVSVESIVKKDWIGQARELSPRQKPQVEKAASTTGQRRADFAVKLQIDADNTVNQIHVMHMQSRGEDMGEDMWDSWDEKRLINFFVQRAELSLAAPDVTGVTDVTNVTNVKDVRDVKPLRIAASAPQAAAIESRQTPASSLPLSAPHSHKLEVIPAESGLPSQVVHHDQPFNVRLSLDLTQVAASSPNSITYTATIHAKSFGSKHLQTVGEVQGSITPGENISLDVEGLSLSQGAYRLGAAVIIDLPSEDLAQRSNYTAYLESGILQVF